MSFFKTAEVKSCCLPVAAAAEEQKTEQLKKRISSSTGEAQKQQEKLLKELNGKVRGRMVLLGSATFLK
jgi:hypothetical protein